MKGRLEDIKSKQWDIADRTRAKHEQRTSAVEHSSATDRRIYESTNKPPQNIIHEPRHLNVLQNLLFAVQIFELPAEVSNRPGNNINEGAEAKLLIHINGKIACMI
jgi:hypothetical protein